MTPRTTSSPAWRQRAIIALAAFAAALAGLYYAGLQLQRWRFEKALVEDYTEHGPLTGPRPSHVAPATPGTVGEALDRALLSPRPPLPPTWVRRELQECLDGQGLANGALPPGCAEVAEAQRAWALAVLASARAADSTLPTRLEGDGSASPAQAPLVRLEAQAVAVGALEARRAAGGGRADAALEWCADGLALARDVARWRGWPGVLTAAHWTMLLTPPCAEALDAATRPAKRRFAQAVDTIAAGLPGEERVHRLAVAARLTQLHGATFSDATLEALPPLVSAGIRRRSPNAPRFVKLEHQRQFVSDAAALRGTLEAVGKGPAARAAAFERAVERLSAGPRPRELRLDEVMVRFDRLQVLLAVLAHAARLDAGDAAAAPPGFSLREEPGARVLAPAAAVFARFAVTLRPDPPELAPPP